MQRDTEMVSELEFVKVVLNIGRMSPCSVSRTSAWLIHAQYAETTDGIFLKSDF